MSSPASNSQTDKSAANVWRFAGCEVDELRREVHVRGERVEVEAKPWELLRQLLLHPGEVVTKDELLESVCGRIRAPVAEARGHACRLLRDSLGERPEFVRLFEWDFETPPYFIESEYAGPNLGKWGEAKGGLAAMPLDRLLKMAVWRAARRRNSVPAEFSRAARHTLFRAVIGILLKRGKIEIRL